MIALTEDETFNGKRTLEREKGGREREFRV